MICISGPEIAEVPAECDGVLLVGEDAESASARAADFEANGIRAAVLVGDLSEGSVRAAARLFAAEIFPGKDIAEI